MKYCKSMCFIFFLLSCTSPYDGYRSRDYGYYGSRSRYSPQGFYNGDARHREIERLRGPSHFIKSELEDRYRGGIDFASHDGEKCDESDFCKQICDTVIERKYKNKCYKAPRVIMERLEDSMFTLLNISQVDHVEISPEMLMGILDMGLSFILDLVENRMSEGDLRSFLAWVAVNARIAEVFWIKDKRARVIEKAFRMLGKVQVDSKNEVATALNLGLIRDDDSFLYLAASENNRFGFKIGYQILRQYHSTSNTRDCKLKQLCARETEIRNRRSRFFDPSINVLRCRTAFEHTRRTSRSTICYIHGATVWSYLDEMIEEREITDRDFQSDGQEVTTEVCNRFCGGRTSRQCQRIVSLSLCGGY